MPEHKPNAIFAVDAARPVSPPPIRVLGERWPNHEDSRRAVLTATEDPDATIRGTALGVLAVRFTDMACPLVCAHSHPDQPVETRTHVAKLLALLWQDEPESIGILTGMTEHDEDEVQNVSKQALVLMMQRFRSAASNQG
ncbi:hypothetical protein [Kitasatospora sp. NPDC085879]|uniref:hypothetical protein n=1 Tax=Kitasatospora sp. NPDC085879 TaxID=3154769 RepID=UPI003419DAB5